MLVQKIVETVNTKLAGEKLTYFQILPFLDETIDDINTQLSAAFPVISDVDRTSDYSFFPDKYIRTVLVPGAAAKFYVMDEEGAETAMQYHRDYQANMFYMKRDYSERIPEAYQDFDKGYVSPLPEETTTTTDPYDFFGW